MESSIDQYRQAAKDIINVYEATSHILVEPTKAQELHVVHGVCSQAIRHCQAAMILSDAGFQREATVNVRAALEHAVTAQWAQYATGQRGRLLKGARRKAAEFYEAAGRYLGKPEIFAPQVEKWKASQGLPLFSQIMEAVDGTDVDGRSLLKFAYRQLSQQVHVTSGTVTSFLDSADLTYLRRKVDDGNPTNTWLCLAMAAALSSYVVEDLRDDKRRRNQIVAIADAAGVPSTLEHDIRIVETRVVE